MRRWQAMLAAASHVLESARDEMQAYADGRSEGWQDSEKAEEMAERIQAIETAMEALQTVTWTG
jgi:hypothetical protein